MPSSLLMFFVIVVSMLLNFLPPPRNPKISNCMCKTNMKTTAIIFVPKIFIYHVKLLCTYENWAYDIPSQTSRLWNFLKYLRITNEKIKIHSSLSLDKSSAFPIFILKQRKLLCILRIQYLIKKKWSHFWGSALDIFLISRISFD